MSNIIKSVFNIVKFSITTKKATIRILKKSKKYIRFDILLIILLLI